VLAIGDEDMELFDSICQRERCIYAVLGKSTEQQQLIVNDPLYDNQPVDMPLELMLGKPPRMFRDAQREKVDGSVLDTQSLGVVDVA